MELRAVVTEVSNIDETTKRMIDPDLKGYIIKTDSVAEPVLDDEGNVIGQNLTSVCQVMWVGKAPSTPAVKPYKADELILLGVDSQLEELFEMIRDLSDRVTGLETALYEEDDDTEDSDIDN